MNAHVDFCRYKRCVYRNFATVSPSQSLVDDLVSDAEEQSLLQDLYYRGEKSIPPLGRVLQRSFGAVVRAEIDSKFTPENWYASRYSDGTWPVLYAAESEETALREVVFHLREFYREELLEAGERQVDRRVCALSIKSTFCVDVLKIPGVNQESLISQDRSGYPYCQKLAERSLKDGAEMLRAPSARQAVKGVCVALFDRDVVVEDSGHLKYLKLVLTWNDCRVLSEEEVIVF